MVQNFETLSISEKMCTVLSNCDIVKLTAKILCDMLKRRRSFLYTSLRRYVLNTIFSFKLVNSVRLVIQLLMLGWCVEAHAGCVPRGCSAQCGGHAVWTLVSATCPLLCAALFGAQGRPGDAAPLYCTVKTIPYDKHLLPFTACDSNLFI